MRDPSRLMYTIIVWRCLPHQFCTPPVTNLQSALSIYASLVLFVLCQIVLVVNPSNHFSMFSYEFLDNLFCLLVFMLCICVVNCITLIFCLWHFTLIFADTTTHVRPPACWLKILDFRLESAAGCLPLAPLLCKPSHRDCVQKRQMSYYSRGHIQ